MTSGIRDTADREAARLAWTRQATQNTNTGLHRASIDAGFRSYWRTEGLPASFIVMDSPPGLEDVRPWLRMHEVLGRHGVRVPQVFARDVEAGFLLLEDLGVPTLAQAIDADSADAWFERAMDQLLRLQAITPPADLGHFGKALLERDAGLFREWFLQRHLGLELDDSELAGLAGVQALLAANALGQPQVMTHRDFMPRNLMPVEPGPAVLDFQDCVTGPIAYDPVSMFKDAFLSWPLARVDGWLVRYHARATEAGLPVPPLATFLRDADWMGVQRHLKILGIFSRLHYRDGKSRYMTDTPRFIAYLDEIVPRHPELQPLRELLDSRIKPALAARAAA